MKDMRVLFTIGGFIVALLGFAFTRSETSNTAFDEIKDRTHKNELSIQESRAFNAEKYATKDELRDVVIDLKDSMNGRFDRIEIKLDKDLEK